MAELKVLAIHGCCLGDHPAEQVSGGIRRATLSALEAGGFDAEVNAPFYGSLLNAYARGEIGLLERVGGLEGVDEESLVGGPGAILEAYADMSEELAAETALEIRLPIPNFVREWALHAFMSDVSTYLAMKRAKEAIWGVITEAWNGFGPEGPDLVVAHSLGTVVAWDVFAKLGSGLPRPKGLLMMGSPLYLSTVRTKMSARISDALDVDNWIHIYDDGDLIAGGRAISTHFAGVEDVEVENPAFPTSHDYPGYIRAAVKADLIGRLVG